MRNLILSAIAAAFGLSLSACVADGIGKYQSTIISGATVIDVKTGDASAADILIEDGRIAALAAPGELDHAGGVETIDATGKFVIPGLWDMHVHLTGDPALEDRVLPLYFGHGVTSVRDTGGADLEKLLELKKLANSGEIPAPRIWIAGPIIDGVPPVHDHSNPDFLAPDAASGVKVVDVTAPKGVDFIKVYEFLTPGAFDAVVKSAHEHGLKVTGHIPVLMTTQQALDAGLDGIEHYRGLEFDCAADAEKLLEMRETIMAEPYEGVPGVKRRRKVHAGVRPEAFATQSDENCNALVQRMAQEQILQTPTLHIVAFRALQFYNDPDWLNAFRYLPEDLKESWLARAKDFTDETKYLEWKTQGEWAIDLTKRMQAAGVPIVAGTDSGASRQLIFVPGATLHNEIKALSLSGLTKLEALQSATLNPPKFFGLGDEFGSVEPGKHADLLILNANPLEDIDNTRSIDAVVSHGVVYDHAALEALLAPYDTGSPYPVEQN